MEDVLDRIIRLCDEKNITQKDLCLRLGLKKSAMSMWKAGKTKSYIRYMPDIAKMLDVSIDYLQTGKEKAPDERTLTEDEWGLIKLLRTVPEDKRDNVFRLVQSVVAMYG